MANKFFTINIEATVTANSEEEARRYLINLALKDKKISSAGMTNDDLDKDLGITSQPWKK